MHPPIQRVRGRHAAVQKQQRQRVQADAGSNVRVSQQRLDLGTEDEQIPLAGLKERLLSGSVAREEQPAPTLVPDGEREHALEPLDERVACLLVEMKNGLRVG